MIQGNSVSWGKSMYGGWYVTYFDNGWKGEHFDKLAQLRAWAKDSGGCLNPHQRWDNI